MEQQTVIAYQNLMLKKMIDECPIVPKLALRKRLCALGTPGKTAYIIFDCLNDNMEQFDNLEATHADIGNMLSISRPNCARALKILEQIGLISVQYKRIRLNKRMKLEEELWG